MPIRPLAFSPLRVFVLCAIAAILAACQTLDLPRDLRPLSRETLQRIAEIGSTPASPIYVRIYKEESELEVWKRLPDGSYALLSTYPICAWSGVLGPKVQEGDRQAPEGFYTVTSAQLNPNSDYYLSFNVGYPNAFDQAWGRTGSNLMVHGACSSAGCYSMTDEQIAEIYALAREAFTGGQREFEVHAFPFRMTPENMARHRDDPNFAFWTMLKLGHDHFEVTRRVPEVAVCDRRYVFDAVAEEGETFDPIAACPPYTVAEAVGAAVEARQEADDALFRAAVARLQAEAGGAAVAAAPASIIGASVSVASFARGPEFQPDPEEETQTASATPGAATAAGEPQGDADAEPAPAAFGSPAPQSGGFVGELFGNLF